MTKLFIATPMYGGMCSGLYTQGMVGLRDVLAQINIQSFYSIMFNESLIPRARNAMTKAFLKSDATHLFFIDADIKFNPFEVPAMIMADKDIICGIYPKKEINWNSIEAAVKSGVPQENLQHHTGAWVVNLVGMAGETSVPISEPLEVWNGGTGFMLIKREVFEKLMPTTPIYRNDVLDLSGNIGGGEEIHEFFKTSIDPDTQRLLSEDYHFCREWRMAGGKVYAAPWLTLGHFGSFLFDGRFLQQPQQTDKQLAAD